MKLIIYFLLICNIGFAAWHFRGLDSWQRNTRPSSNNLVVSDESQLILLSEFKPQEKKSVTQLGLKQCYSLGPFSNKSESGKAQKLLEYNNFATKRVSVRDESLSGFWVVLPASKSLKEAKKEIERLKSLKIKDYFLVATGSHENGISLGVFSREDSARRRIDEMNKLGFFPEIQSVLLPQNIYWLNWDKESQVQPDPAIINNVKNKFSQVSVIEKSCI
jgi:hypothetical protein